MKPDRITRLLVASFCLLAAVLFFVGWQGISHLRQLHVEMQNSAGDQWYEVQLTHEAFHLSELNSRLTLLIFLLDDPDEIDRLLASRTANTKRISEVMATLEPRLDPGTEIQLFAAVKATRTPYIESYQQALFLLLQKHKRDEARKMMIDVVRPNLMAYHNAWDAFDKHESDEIDQVIQQSNADYIAGEREFLLTLGLATLIAGSIALFTVWRMDREISIRSCAERALHRAHVQLEQRVVERTTDLQKANEALELKIVEQKHTEETLRESDEKFRQMAENISDMFWMTSPDMQQVLYVSPAYESIWGHSPASLYAHPGQWAEAIPQEDRERVFTLFSTLGTGISSASTEFQISRPDGEMRWIYGRGFPVRDAAGSVIRLTGIATDITDRKHIESRLLQSQKMETVGKLAGGIAHEFNSILTAIIGQSELLLTDLPAGSPLGNNAREIRQAAERAASLTRQLLAYGRKQILQPEILDLNRLLTGMVNTLQHLMGREVDVRIVQGPGLKPVKIDPGQMEQVIVNMAMNAAEAMPNGGKFILETTNVTLDEEFVRPFPGLATGDYVMLAMSDTGIGMSEEVKARVFEPFFSTKSVGEGTGLGLATCHGILKQSGGHLNVYSEVARGTTFKIYLPQVEQRTKTAPLQVKSGDLPRGTETILLAEDDPSLLKMSATLLRRLGYTVLTAANGVEALNLKNQRNVGHIDLLFTDVVMPHMSGKELSDRIRAIYPDTRILFTSAFTENAIVHQGILNGGVTLLQKPFTPSELAHKVREVLDQVSPQHQ